MKSAEYKMHDAIPSSEDMEWMVSISSFKKTFIYRYYHTYLHKFRFVEPSIPYSPMKEHPYMSELALFPAYAAIAPECAI